MAVGGGAGGGGGECECEWECEGGGGGGGGGAGTNSSSERHGPTKPPFLRTAAQNRVSSGGGTTKLGWCEASKVAKRRSRAAVVSSRVDARSMCSVGSDSTSNRHAGSQTSIGRGMLRPVNEPFGENFPYHDEKPTCPTMSFHRPLRSAPRACARACLGAQYEVSCLAD